jgi:FkbH-like protein
MVDLSSLADLGPEQLEFLRRRLQEAPKRRAASDPGRIPPRPSSGPAPLSFSQQRIWILVQLGADPAASNIAKALRIRGRLDIPALAGAFAEIVRRHEALRLRISVVDGLPEQAPLPAFPLPLPQIDLSRLAPARREPESLRLAAAEGREPFSLTGDRFLRAAVLRLGPEDHLLLVTLHHIIADNLSMVVLVQELSALYDALSRRRPSPLPALPIQYLDFVAWQQEQIQGQTLEGHLAYWTQKLAGAPPTLDLPTDHPWAGRSAFRVGRCPIRYPEALAGDLAALARREGSTLFMVLLAAFKALLHRYAGATDLVVGVLIGNRNRKELESLIGLFANTVLIRTDLSGDPDLGGLLARVRDVTLEAHAHQDLPFDRLVEKLRPERVQGRTPLFQVAFNLQETPVRFLQLGDLSLTPVEIFRGTADLDLYLSIEDTKGGIFGMLEYDADLFTAETAAELVEGYERFLERFARQPGTRLSRLQIPEALQAKAQAARLRDRKQRIAVAATFSAEPLADALRYWMGVLDIPAELAFAPYQQIVQQLISPGSLFTGNPDGVNVALVRFEDWLRYGEDTGSVLPAAAALERIRGGVRDLLDALGAAPESARVPLLLCLCAPSPQFAGRTDLAPDLEALEDEIRTAAGGLPHVHLIEAGEIARLYPVAGHYEPYGDKHAHVPFTAGYFAAVASMLARRIHALRQPPCKVVVLDCDNTLWKGVCAEAGPGGVEIGPAYGFLQDFFLRQKDAGKLLCLCSKNNPEDVFNVFDGRPEMRLRREDLVAWRIGWQSKSESLRSLAEELGLGLDSFVFVDDNPVECAEVRAACPEVITLQLPEEPERIQPFLRHAWVFDSLRVSDEDRRRTSLYQQNLARERTRSDALTLREFLDKLELQVDIRPMDGGELARVSQLTQLTNQFNTTTIRRSEAEVQALLLEGGAECLTVRVRDRFGDYGLVGVVFFTVAGGALAVDTLLLSCRVLGRYVEHRVIAHLGRIALDRGLERIEIRFRPTERSSPVRDFLGSLDETGGEAGFALSARAVAELPCLPDDGQPSAAQAAAAAQEAPTRSASRGRDGGRHSDLLQRIAMGLVDAEEIARRAEAGARASRAGAPGERVPPRDPLEEALAEIWKEVLGIDEVGVEDNFLTSGGHSLLGTVLMSRIQKAFGVEMELAVLFRAPTIAALSRELETRLITDMDAAEMEQGMSEIAGLSTEEVRRALAPERLA